MTCIVGLIDKEKNKVYIGGDSASVGNYNLSIRKDPKVFIRDKFIMGFTSSFRMGQLLMYDDRFSMRAQNATEDDFHYMVNAFVPAVQKLFSEGGYLMKDKEELIGGFFLVGYKQHLYMIQSDFQVEEKYDDYSACGCGQDLALGSLFTSKDFDLDPEKRVVLALESAAKHSAGVSGPFTILSL